MSALPVPLTVRIGTEHVTSEVSGLSFRKEAVGGVRSISLRLARPLDRFDADLTAYARVYIYDARTAAVVAEGRLADLGRTADDGGQAWDCVAFGPAQHASDKTVPYILVDTSLEGFQRSKFSLRTASTDAVDDDGDPALEIRTDEGKTIGSTWVGSWINFRLRRAGFKVARATVTRLAGITNSDYRLMVIVRPGNGSGTIGADVAASTTSSVIGTLTPDDYALSSGYDTVELRARRQNTSIAAAETHWFQFSNVSIRSVLKTATGADVSSGYTVTYVRAHEVVRDLLGRVLDQYDGAGATIDTGGTYQIDQFCYPDGVTPEQVLTDLMALEPAYRWYTTPTNSSGKYGFAWEPWPTTVRYEATLDDGGSFPASASELYNRVLVRFNYPNGAPGQVVRTKACQILDDAGITRQAYLDLGDEVGSINGANRMGDNFLAEHNVPKNAGTLNVARRIRDLKTGTMVEPFEIEPGELIRVRGIEGYADALNASTNDGQTVFRIWSVEYNSDNHAATLELDTDARTVSAALAKLARRRARKR